MRYSNYIGILAGLLMIAAAAFPWIYIPSIDATVTGFGSSTLKKFGMPVIMNMILFAVNIVLFLIPRMWAKRMNPFVGAIGFAWSLRNLLILSICSNECPDKKIGLYIYFGASLLLLIMTLLPDLKIKDNK